MSTSHPSPEWQSDNSLLACLQHLFDTRIGADVRFLIGERQDITMGHRSILICRSPVFCDILATQNPDPVLCEWSLKVTNTTTNIFDIFLRYLYTDYVSEEITESIAMALISLAQRYRVNTLVNYLKGILNNVQKTVPNSVKTSDSVSPQSNVTGRQFSALGRVWHSTCDNSMYLVNTGNRNPTQTSEGVVPVGRTEQGTNLHRNQDKTHTDHRNTVLVTDTENNRTMHFKVDEAEEDSETSENTPGNLTSDSHVRSPCDRKSESHTSDKDVDDTSQYMLNKRPIPFIKTEVEDDSFDHSVSSQGTGFPVGTNEDARFQLPLRTVSQTETMTSDIKEELPTEESMDTQTPSERDYTVTYSQDLANIQSGETTPAAGFKRKGRMRRGDNEVSGDNVMSGRDLYPAGLTTQHTGVVGMCQTCGRVYTSKQGLMDHIINAHTHDYKFTCGQCQKGFTSRTLYQSHVLMHMQEKSYVCEICNKRYAHNKDLKAHMAAKHQLGEGKKSFDCTQCPAKFSYEYSLRRHVTTKHLDLVFSCEVCADSFQHRSSLTRHMKKKHQIPN